MLTIGRVASARWRKLSALLTGVERSVEASARLDAHDGGIPHSASHTRAVIAFNARLTTLERQIDRELDRLTVERLTLDLREKQRRAPWARGAA